MASHTQPNEQQIKPMHEERLAGWAGFTKAATYGVLAVVAILGLMALFLVKH